MKMKNKKPTRDYILQKCGKFSKWVSGTFQLAYISFFRRLIVLEEDGSKKIKLYSRII